MFLKKRGAEVSWEGEEREKKEGGAEGRRKGEGGRERGVRVRKVRIGPYFQVSRGHQGNTLSVGR